MKSLLRRWRIKLFSWEYWPWQIIYFPVFLYWIILALRSGSMLYTCGANPKIRNGGMIGESKYDILRLIPSSHRPKDILIDKSVTSSELVRNLALEGLHFPLIGKPDVGERGFMVEKLTSIDEVLMYSVRLGHPFILQEFIDLPVEAGIFYYRFPGESSGHVTSVVLKKMLSITGNGKKTFGELVMENDRSFLQVDPLRKKYAVSWNEIVERGLEIELVSIGNHCRGTTFLNGNHLISNTLKSSMDKLSRQVSGFNYGRFDVRAASRDDLLAGNFKVLELNGASAEPAHIYQPGASFLEGQKTLFRHWHIMFKISQINHKVHNVYFPTIRESLREYRRFSKLKVAKSS